MVRGIWRDTPWLTIFRMNNLASEMGGPLPLSPWIVTACCRYSLVPYSLLPVPFKGVSPKYPVRWRILNESPARGTVTSSRWKFRPGS